MYSPDMRPGDISRTLYGRLVVAVKIISKVSLTIVFCFSLGHILFRALHLSWLCLTSSLSFDSDGELNSCETSLPDCED